MSQSIEDTVRTLVEKLVLEYSASSVGVDHIAPSQYASGIFPTMDLAVKAAYEAQRYLVGLPLEKRKEIVQAMRETAMDHAQEFAEMAVQESGRGNVADKIAKNILAAKKTPGVEDVETSAYSDEHGLSLVERAPYGVIGSITPVTNPTATIINNGISMISGGNSVVFNPHPGAKNVSCFAIEVLNAAIERVGGPRNLMVSLAQPTIESANEMMKHQKISLLVVTGGPGVVKAAMNSGKKVIAAGPGNPPCVVDETAKIQKAAKDIVDGASFDNNLVCICEKEVLVVKSVANELIGEMQKVGAYLLSDQQTKSLLDQVIEVPGMMNSEGVVKREYVGKSPSFLASLIGVTVPESTRLLICDVDAGNPLVWTEQLMPFLPIVRMENVDQCIDLAVQCEHGFRHTAIMHSLNVEKLSKMARQMNCSLFVKNGPCYAGLGNGGAGHTSFTIASPTGEGLTRARTFTRERRCTLVDYFRII